MQGEPGGVSALLGVPRLLDAMRAHYGGVASADAARPPAGAGGLLPAELRALRQGLLNVALSLLHLSAVPSHKAPRIAPHDVQACPLAWDRCLTHSLHCLAVNLSSLPVGFCRPHP
jgi:hypothetical protein